MTAKPVIYTDFLSTEPLDIIRANECHYHIGELSTSRFRALWNEIERLRALVNGAEGIFANCEVTSGCCCCGDSMINHPSPITCGHSPVDQGAYNVREWMKQVKGNTNA